MKKRIALLGIIALISLPAIGGTIRHDVDDELYRLLSYNEQFDSVGRVLFNTSAGGTRLCSGTVVHSNWVLTAAHCVDQATNMTFQLPQYNSGRMAIESHTTYTATSWLWHHGWTLTNGNLLAGWDIGLMYFENPFTVNPATIYAGSNELGAVTTHVGYGNTGTGLTGEQSGTSGTRRAGNNVVDVLYSEGGTGQQILWSDFDHPDADATNNDGVVHNDAWNAFWLGNPSANEALPLEYSIGRGDSGGGAFIEENGERFLAGVHSFLFNVNGGAWSEYGDAFGSVRVSEFSDWILSNTGTTAIPNPTTLSLFGIGLILLWARRRECSRSR